MTRRIVLVLTVLMMLFTVTTTVATADNTMKPDGVWLANDGGDVIRFTERARQKTVRWHSDSFAACRGGSARSVSGEWSYDDGGIQAKIWPRCDNGVRVRPFTLSLDWSWTGDLFDPSSETLWQNYLYHKAPPECIDMGDHSIYSTNVVGLNLVIDIPDGEFDVTLGNYVANLVCSANGCDNWHVDVSISDTLDETIIIPPFPPIVTIPAGTLPDVLVLEAAGPVRPCETVVCAVQGFVSLPIAPFPWDETNIAGYATCEAIFGP